MNRMFQQCENPKLMSDNKPKLTRRTEQFISDDRRVITRLLVPGDAERIRGIIDRILNLSHEQASGQLDEVMRNFSGRHRNVVGIFDRSAREILQIAPVDTVLTEQQRMLVGAYFTMEYAIEAAALFNPSIVPHMDQSGMEDGACRFILSLRATGEGHISSIAFRTGVVDARGNITFEELSPYVASVMPDRDAIKDKYQFFLKLIEMGGYNEQAGHIIDELPDRFTAIDLQHVVAELRQGVTGDTDFEDAAESMIWLAHSNYQLSYPTDCPISEMVIFPVTENESRGIEDARFVRFVDDDGSVTYYGTYTAYNGFHILPQILTTKDFRRFHIMTMNGKCVQNKGMALFPRKVGGKFMMIGRLDNENLFLMRSSNVRFWNDATKLRGPEQPWEIIQIGNCGSPIETEHGWILLTHGVGPMRRYCIGAMLLDLDNPSKIIASASRPLIEPNEKEREGYVPNVVYTCGALRHNGQLLIPYAVSDSATTFANIAIDDLLDFITS